MADNGLGIAGAIGEGLSKGVDAYQKERDSIEDRALKRKALAIQLAGHGLMEDPAGNFVRLPGGGGMDQEYKQLQIQKLKKELGEGSDRVAALKPDDRKRFDFVREGYGAVNAMADALNKGDSVISLMGDNDFTRNMRLAAETFGRMQSGGAINKAEEDRFNAMGPGVLDSPEMKAKKIKQMQDLYVGRLRSLGLNPEDVAEFGHEVAYSPAKGGGGLMGLAKGLMSSPDESHQDRGLMAKKKTLGLMDGGGAQAGGKVRVSNGKESFDIDPSDLKEAQRDGFKVVK